MSFTENFASLRVNEFQNPQKMVFGIGTVERVGDEAKRLGAGRVFVVSDENIEKVGILGKVVESLRAKALKIQVYKISAAEPTMASAEAVARAVRREKYDVVVGVGGGSCLDSAKLAALTATNPGKVQGYCARVKGKVRAVDKDTLPKILIPTTAGTGSEASNTLVIIEGEYKTWITDNRVLADVALVDPALTVTLPPRMTAGTGVDALSHVVEALMSVQANALSDALSLAAVKLIFTSLRTACHHGEDLDARRNMALAATLGGWVIGFPWIGGPATIGHCIAEAVGSKYKIPHGVACGIALPYAMEYNLPFLLDKLGTVAAAMGAETEGLMKREAAYAAVEATFELMDDVEMPLCLRDAGVPEADLEPLAKYIIEERQYLYGLSAYNPRRPTLPNVTHLLEQMWEGEIE